MKLSLSTWIDLSYKWVGQHTCPSLAAALLCPRRPPINFKDICRQWYCEILKDVCWSYNCRPSNAENILAIDSREIRDRSAYRPIIIYLSLSLLYSWRWRNYSTEVVREIWCDIVTFGAAKRATLLCLGVLYCCSKCRNKNCCCSCLRTLPSFILFWPAKKGICVRFAFLSSVPPSKATHNN